MATKAGKVVLVDGSWLVFRAFFAIPPAFSTSAGLHTNAIYGFATMFRKLFAGRRPSHGAVVFDAPGPLHREARYPAYKAQRPAMPQDLVEQLPWIDRLVRAQRFPLLRCPGWEADDVIGTLAHKAASAGHEVLIVAGDKDFAQLIDDRVRMYDSMRDVTYDAELARKKWGVKPHQMIDLLALLGDSADNIPGVAGIGEKSATDLLERFGDVAGIYANLAALTPRQRTALLDGEASAKLSRELATIDLAAPVGVELDDLALHEPDPAELDSLYRDLEFRSLLTVQATAPAAAPVAILDGDANPWLMGGCIGIAPVLGDAEGGARALIGLGLCRGGEARYLRAADVPGIARWLADSASPKVAHDSKALRKALDRVGLALRGCDDTMLASFLVDPTRCIPHDLDRVSKEYLQRPVSAWKSIAGGLAPTDVPEATAAAWAGEQASAVSALWSVLSGRLEEAEQAEIYADQELPLSLVLAGMERTGILVDAEDLARLGVELRERKAALEADVHAAAGHAFNLGSTQQLATVLFEELKLPVLKKNKTGYSTDAEVLELLAREHPIARLILDHRSLAKLISTYTDVLQEAVDPSTGRIHATFQQTVGVSGRLISTDPDLQRTPVRTPDGKRIRAAFVAPPGRRMVSADWSQIELRVLAHFSGDPRLVQAFANEDDVHRATAAQLFHTSPEAVTAAQRNVGKTINFATIYGQGATALAQILGVKRTEAQGYIDGFFDTYAGVRRWLDTTIADATRLGYVTTLSGRRRFIPELSSHSPMDRQGGERIAANTPIQGSAADLCKLAMLAIDRRLQGMESRMLLQVHDELVFEAPEAEVDALVALVTEEMTRPMRLVVPLKVNVGVGRSWGEAH